MAAIILGGNLLFFIDSSYFYVSDND